MEILYIFLLAGLGVGALVLVLLCAKFIQNESTSSKRNCTPNNDEEERMELNQSQNNNVPMPPARTRSVSTASTTSDIQISVEEMRAIQKGLLRNGELALDGIKDCNLLIAIYANSLVFTGYCVNLEERWVQFYKIHTKDLPWILDNPADNSEFEMRNFTFALLLWTNEIAKAKQFHIYIGSPAVNYENNKLSNRVETLLKHFSECDGIIVGNDCKFYVNPRKDAKSFSVKILPAEDLANDNFGEFESFVSQYYLISTTSFSGSHWISEDGGEQIKQNVVSENYQGYIGKVLSAKERWNTPCEKCGYKDDETASIVSINEVS